MTFLVSFGAGGFFTLAHSAVNPPPTAADHDYMVDVKNYYEKDAAAKTAKAQKNTNVIEDDEFDDDVPPLAYPLSAQVPQPSQTPYESAPPYPNDVTAPASSTRTRTSSVKPQLQILSGVSKPNRGIQSNAQSAVVSSTDRSRQCLKLDPYTGQGKDVIANFSFPDSEIIEIAETLGRLTCLNFIFDKDVAGKISIISHAQITTGDAWKAFLTGLDAKGFSIVPSGKFLRIVKQRDAKDKQVKTYTGNYSPDTDLLITRLIPLKYVNSLEVERVLKNFIPPSARLVAHEASNTLIITDTGSNVRKLVDMINILDVERVDERIELIQLSYASASEVARLMGQLLPTGSAGMPGANFSGYNGGFPSGGGKMPGMLSGVRKSREGGTISNVIPDDRTNSLIVSANEKGMQDVREIVKKLDSRVNPNLGGNRFHVIFLQFADAEEISKTLSSLLGAGGGGTQGAPGIGGAKVPTQSGQIFESSVKIAADKPTNSIVVTGTPADFATVSQVIAKLDVPRDQVYVEAVIMETMMDRKFDAGINFALPKVPFGFTSNDNLAKFLVNPLSIPGAVLGFADTSKPPTTVTIPSASGGTVTTQISSIQGLIQLLLRNTNSNILATPSIQTLDNQEAKIEISEKIPIPTQSTNANLLTQTTVSKESVSLILRIKPQINKSSNFVKLEIHQQMEDISERQPPKAVQDLAFATSNRASDTMVMVQDGDTVVIGGLVRDKSVDATTKVPILGDIPILGWLFRSKSSNVVKQNLLVFITPTVIKHYPQERAVLDRKIRERDEFIEKNMGGEDVFKDKKMEIIRNLPPLAKLQDNVQVVQSDTPEVDAQQLKQQGGVVKRLPLQPSADASEAAVVVRVPALSPDQAQKAGETLTAPKAASSPSTNSATAQAPASQPKTYDAITAQEGATPDNASSAVPSSGDAIAPPAEAATAAQPPGTATPDAPKSADN